MTRMLRLSTVVVLIAAAGCGGDSDSTKPEDPGNSGGNSMTATIDGQPWTGTAAVSRGPIITRAGTIIITGSKLAPQSAISLTLSFVDGPGTYPLGVNYDTNAGGNGAVAKASEFWFTPFSGAAGTVTITTRTDTRIAGSFSFTAERTGTTPTTTVVTDGHFDVTKSAGLPPLPTGLPSEMTASLNGTAWNAATILAEAPGGSFGGSNTAFSVTFSSQVPVVAGHTYRIGPQIGLTIHREDTNDSWENASQDSVGYVSVVTLTDERMTGSFGGTLPPFGTATSPMAVTNGAFSVHLQ